MGPCSMERRPEPAFDFNEPTLEARVAAITAKVRGALRGRGQRHLHPPSPLRSCRRALTAAVHASSSR